MPLVKAIRRSNTEPEKPSFSQPPMAPSKDAAQLLSRLLTRSGDTAARPASVGAPQAPQSGHAALGGSKEVFSHIKEPASSSTTPAGGVGREGPLAPGHRMKLTGLEKAPNLNGMAVQLIDYNFEKQRWNVKRSDDGSIVGVQTNNLVPLSAPIFGANGAHASTAQPRPAAPPEGAPAPYATSEKLEAWLISAREKGTLEKAARYLRAIAKKGGNHCVKGYRIEEQKVAEAFKKITGKELSSLEELPAGTAPPGAPSGGGAAATPAPGATAAAGGASATSPPKSNPEDTAVSKRLRRVADEDCGDVAKRQRG